MKNLKFHVNIKLRNEEDKTQIANQHGVRRTQMAKERKTSLLCDNKLPSRNKERKTKIPNQPERENKIAKEQKNRKP